MFWFFPIIFFSGSLYSSSLAQNECTLPECIKHAEEIVQGMNPDINPCDDFFEYACGGWEKQTRVPENEDSVALLDIMSKKIDQKLIDMLSGEQPTEDAFLRTYNFYQSCMNEPSEDQIVQSLSNIIEDIGGWPILGDDLQVTSYEELLQFQGEMLKRGAQGVLFNIETDKLGNGPLSISPPKSDGISELNPKEVYSFVRLFNNELTRKEVHKDVMRMNKFIDKMYELAELDDRVRIMPATEVQMLPVIKKLFDSIRSVDDSEKIKANKHNFAYLQTLDDYRAIVNFQIFLYVKNILKQLQFTKSYPVVQNFVDTINQPKNCLELTKQCYDDALGLMYAKKYHNLDKDENILKEMFGNIMEVLKEGAERAQWMDEESRAGALRKMNKLHGYFELPNWALKMDTLNEYYKNFEASSNDIIKNSASCRAQTFIQKLRATTEMEKELPWDESTFQADAVYYSELNIFRLFEGYVENPAFHSDWLSVMKYSSLGEVIGHEISHGFDNDGVHYNENGDFKQWMTEQSAANYQEIVQCFVEHYDKLVDTDFPSKHVNGTQTAPENIADNEGLKLAFYAYKKWVEEHGEEKVPEVFGNFNIDNVFFLSYAHTNCEKRVRPLEEQSKDEHAATKVRINGVLSNMPEFSNAFSCPVGTFMNPSNNKCRIW